MPVFKLAPPDLQIGFSSRLISARAEYLQQALHATVRAVPIAVVNSELSALAPASDLQDLAALGMRGESVFTVPVILRARPALLAYYRMLLGYSQKAFYDASTGMGPFSSLESKDLIPSKIARTVPALCGFLCGLESYLLAGLRATAAPSRSLNEGFLDDLTLLTLGTFFRGSNNVEIGIVSARIVFGIVKQALQRGIISSTGYSMTVTNAAGRQVDVVFGADPDVVVNEHLSNNTIRPVLAIEIKGGRDFSNIHNRLGEAEKSHQKAKGAGYLDRWTVVNVNRTDIAKAGQESPSTTKFFLLDDLEAGGPEAARFVANLQSVVGI